MTTEQKTDTRKQPHSNAAAEAAQEILAMATPKDGEELTVVQQKELFTKCETTIRANVEGFYAFGLADR